MGDRKQLKYFVTFYGKDVYTPTNVLNATIRTCKILICRLPVAFTFASAYNLKWKFV